MTAVSQILALGAATAPVIPVPEASPADASGFTTDALFLQVMHGVEPVVPNLDVPLAALRGEGAVIANAPLPVPRDVADDLPVADAAVLSPLAQNFISVALPIAAAPPPVDCDGARATASVSADRKNIISVATVLAVPVSFGGDAEKARLQLLDDGAQAATPDALVASQPQASQTTSLGAPPVIAKTFESKPTDPSTLDASKPVALVPPPDQTTPETVMKVSPTAPDQALPLVTKAAEIPEMATQEKAANATTLTDQPLDWSIGKKAVSPTVVMDQKAAPSFARQSDDLQLAAAIPTSTESAWRQKWIGASPDTNLPALVDPTLPRVLQGGAGLGSIVSGLTPGSASNQSGLDSSIPAAPAPDAPPLPEPSRQAPPVSTDVKPRQPAPISAVSDQGISPVELPLIVEASSLVAIEPGLRAASKDVQISPSAATLAQTLTPALVEMTRRGDNGPIDLALAPEELGRLTISLRPEGDLVHVSMLAERPETLDLLRRHAGDLLADLRQSGFSGASFSFGQSGQDQTQQFADRALDTDAAGPAQSMPLDFKQSALSLPHQGAGLDLRF